MWNEMTLKLIGNQRTQGEKRLKVQKCLGFVFRVMYGERNNKLEFVSLRIKNNNHSNYFQYVCRF